MLNTFTEEALQTEGKIIVKFGAPWCGPCKQIDPILEQIQDEGYAVFIVNTDEDQDSTIKYGIRSVPTTIIFENGEPIETLLGVQSKSTITKLMGK